MKNLIIKGDGNSRYLKSVSNFLTLYPTYSDFVAALVAGTLPIDLNGINTTGVTQLGTPLNKSTLLSDATATALGLTGDPTVDDALAAVATDKANLASPSFTGTPTAPTAAGGTNTTQIATTAFVESEINNNPRAVSRIETGFYTGDGTYGSANPTSITFANAPKVVVIHGYVYLWGNNSFWIWSGNTPITLTVSVSGNTMSWYYGSATSAAQQLNVSGATYNWVAIS